MQDIFSYYSSFGTLNRADNVPFLSNSLKNEHDKTTVKEGGQPLEGSQHTTWEVFMFSNWITYLLCKVPFCIIHIFNEVLKVKGCLLSCQVFASAWVSQKNEMHLWHKSNKAKEGFYFLFFWVRETGFWNWFDFLKIFKVTVFWEFADVLL